MNKVINEIGEENVVHVVTDSESAYKSTDERLLQERPHLFWSPCAAHCIDMMLEDIGKMEKVKKTIDKAKHITNFIYNSDKVVNLMKSHMNDQELLRLGITRFAIQFIVIESLLRHHIDLKRMCLTPELEERREKLVQIEVPATINMINMMPVLADTVSLMELHQFMPLIIKNGLYNEHLFQTKLVSLFCKFGSLNDAVKVFEPIESKIDPLYHTILKGYAQQSNFDAALKFFVRMKYDGASQVVYNFSYLLKACADVKDVRRGKEIHGQLILNGFESNLFAMASVMNLYAKCRMVHEAYKMFDRMPERDLVCWNTVIAGFAQNGMPKKALELFSMMQGEGHSPDLVTVVSVLPASASIGNLKIGRSIHAYVLRWGLESYVNVATALLDMYAKCGLIGAARKIFDSMGSRTVVSWNSMIDGYAQNGNSEEALDLFQKMVDAGLKASNVTVMGALHACANLWLVKEGRHYFSVMKEKYGLEPSMDHYGAMVDLLGRSGQLNEAWDFIQNMPVEPAINVYGAMLGACKIHKNVDLGEIAADKLFEFEPDEGGYHVLLANIYAIASMWEKVAKVRTLMEKKGIQKTPGCSSVDLRNEVHTFYSGSTKHPQSDKIYAYLEKLMDRIKLAGYIPDTSSIHDVEDDIQEKLLNTHSEKLAISFGLISTKPGTTIHIRKNLRVCGDCHNATKYISLVTKREIIVRDMHRFHHFKNGTCSCGDYW
ncbi:hypothetical protein BUALT_Bualt01G0193800 [Buddleja alternifolia]|uniref:Pentatricopeptide repeat-containing protein n=1 Tax=Buddleja alternifolia TaxID=168488 RepID=A0AAV6Y8J7_9LAMI|nr:hypothetical protein BUALT_Bualt01G0193800 [Buddleja alternifolia]